MNTCPNCGKEMKFIPAGISKKTGNSYNAFFACPDKCSTNKAIASPAQAQNGRKDGFQVLGETLYRIEEKLDILLGDKGLKTEFKASEIPVVEEEPEYEEEHGEVDVNSMPF